MANYNMKLIFFVVQTTTWRKSNTLRTFAGKELVKQPQMKQLSSLLLLLCLIPAGCKKADKFTQFDMPYTQTVTVQSSTGVNLPFNIITPDVETNSESTFSSQNTKKDFIESIYVKKLRLTIQSPSGGDFSFLRSISVHISANGLSESKIAWKDNIPDSQGNSIEMDVTGTDLKEYIKQDNFKLRLNTVTDELLTSDHKIDIYSVFEVDAKLIRNK